MLRVKQNMHASKFTIMGLIQIYFPRGLGKMTFSNAFLMAWVI